MGWGFFFMMVVLKIPIALLLWLVWWAIHAEPVDQDDDNPDEGGGDTPPHRPRAPKPRPSRRGPHREPPPRPPARVRALPPAPAHRGRPSVR